MKLIKFIPSLLLLFLFSCCTKNPVILETGFMKVDSVTTRQFVTPVLIGNENNPVLQVKVFAQGKIKPYNVTGLKINTNETSNPDDIEEVKIYYTGGSQTFNAEYQFGQTSLHSEEINFKGNQSLQHGVNIFWVSFKLKSSASLLNKVYVGCEYLTLNDNNKISPKNIDPPLKKRVGIALRKHGDDGVDTYRIPGLATTNEGYLIAVYDIRRNSSVDLQADADIGMSRSTNGGQTWESMKVIMDMGEWGGKPNDQNGIGDPALLVDRETGTIWVAAIWAHGYPGERIWLASKPGLKPENTSQFMLVKSEDDGITWSEPINITRQIKKSEWYLLLQGPGKGITLSDGTLVFPAQFKDKEQMPHSTIIYSKDHGKNWHIGTGAKSNTTEAQVVELENGSLMLNMRDNRNMQDKSETNGRSVCITNDLGKTWTEHSSSRGALPEPTCMASLIRYTYFQDGVKKNMLLFSNPNNKYGRKDMTIKASFDEGNTWPEKYHKLLDEGYGRGYSCMTTIDENTIGILYEGSQADLVFEKILVEEILNQGIK